MVVPNNHFEEVPNDIQSLAIFYAKKCSKKIVEIFSSAIPLSGTVIATLLLPA